MCHAQLRGSQPQDLLKLLAQIKLRWTCSLPARPGAGLTSCFTPVRPLQEPEGRPDRLGLCSSPKLAAFAGLPAQPRSERSCPVSSQQLCFLCSPSFCWVALLGHRFHKKGMCSEVIFRAYTVFEMCFQGDLELTPKAAPVKNGSQCPERHPAPRAGTEV